MRAQNTEHERAIEPASVAVAESHPVVVVGAGAAGLLAALLAARRGLEVVLVESTKDGGRKILRSWPLTEQRAFFETELGMPLELEEETGKLFPSSHRARDVRDGLVARVREAGARMWFGARVTGLSSEDGGWTVQIHGAPPIQASAVIVATGGLSVPTTGSDGAGLSMVQRLGHGVSSTYPALTPLTGDPHPHLDLAGIATGVTLTAPGSKPSFRTTDALLITHRGWSGPAVLDASHLATRGQPGDGRQEILVDWTGVGGADWDARLLGGGGNVRSAVAPRLPRRLADSLVREVGVAPETALSQLRRQDRQAIVEALTAYRLPWTGHEGYKKAEVTGGGIKLEEIDPRTMESRRAPGLYLCGEILDAFGPIGGHNFLWAFATGRAAGASVCSPTPVRGSRSS